MQSLKAALPVEISQAIDSLNSLNLQEIRLRTDRPTTVLYYGKKYFLSANGITADVKNAISVSYKDMENFVMTACQHSLHSFAEQLSKGFLAAFDGVRIGLCGTFVIENGISVSIKEISSLNIRIPREVKGCSIDALPHLTNPIANVLILSKPGAGKTTFLRDLIYQTSFLQNPPNVLIADERNEISGSSEGKIKYNLGNFCDVISMADKVFAFRCGVRTMTPDVLACDEICCNDLEELKQVSECGVKLFCTIHGQDIDDIKRSDFMTSFLDIFDRFVILSNERKIGEVVGIYDKKFSRLDR